MMSIFEDALKGFTSGVRNGVIASFLSSHIHGNAAPSIESLCRDNGWTIDEHQGNTLRLHFTDHERHRRTLRIDRCPGSWFVLLSASSIANPTSRDVPPEILPWLLRRNAEVLTGAWEIRPSGNGRVTFLFAYAALAEGLTPLSFKALCESIVHEAAEFDSKLEQAGLLC